MKEKIFWPAILICQGKVKKVETKSGQSIEEKGFIRNVKRQLHTKN